MPKELVHVRGSNTRVASDTATATTSLNDRRQNAWNLRFTALDALFRCSATR